MKCRRAVRRGAELARHQSLEASMTYARATAALLLCGSVVACSDSTSSTDGKVTDRGVVDVASADRSVGLDQDGPPTDVGPASEKGVTKVDKGVTKVDKGVTKVDKGVTKVDKGGPSPDITVPPPPPATCTIPAQPVDTSKPTAVVGSGTAASCTEAALTTALAGGGIVTFNCGTAAHTITVTAEKVITKDTVIDGKNMITLGGGGASRILNLKSVFNVMTPTLTVQNLTFSNGRTTDVANTKDVKAGGAAIFRLGGKLVVINSKFYNNHCADTGQDVSGGAITSQGGAETIIVGSTFSGNSGSNGGAIGNLGNSLTIVNSMIVGNAATGSGGNPGNGGNGGGVVIDGKGTTISICGTTISNNKGNAYGGGLFRVSYQLEPTNIDRCAIDGNSIPDQTTSMAGGLYLQGTTVNLTASTISGNSARAAGGMFIGPSSALNMTNVTVAGNTAHQSLGGGMSISSPVTGKIQSCTIAYNATPGTVAFGAGIAGGSTQITLTSTIIAQNTVGNGWNPINCTQKLANGGGNFQWPAKRAGGGSDDPSALCSDGVTFIDPLLGTLVDNGGPTKTIAPKTGSPVIGKGVSCPATDQRGQARKTPCTSGAYEM
jgi:hypothetical protein